MTMRSLQRPRTDKALTECEVRRRSRHVDVTGAVTVTASTVNVQGKNSGAHLTEFDSSLTIQNSNFHNGSRILAKIKVVEEEKMHNFRFGRKLIWSSDQ